MKKNYIKLLVTLLLTIVGQGVSGQVLESVIQSTNWTYYKYWHNDKHIYTSELIDESSISAKKLNNCNDTDLINGNCIQINWSNTAYNDLQQREYQLKAAATSQLNSWFNAQKTEIVDALESKYNKDFSSFEAAKDNHIQKIAENELKNSQFGSNTIYTTTNYGQQLQIDLQGSSTKNFTYSDEYFIELRSTKGKFSSLGKSSTLQQELINFYEGVQYDDLSKYNNSLSYINIREGVAKELAKYLENAYNSQSTYNKIGYLAETFQYGFYGKGPVANLKIIPYSEFQKAINNYRIKNSETYKYAQNALDILNNDYNFYVSNAIEPYILEADKYLDKLIEVRNERLYGNDTMKAASSFFLSSFPVPNLKEIYFYANMRRLTEKLNGNFSSVLGSLDPDVLVPEMYDLYESKRKAYILNRANSALNNGGIPLYNLNYVNYGAFDDMVKYDLPEYVAEQERIEVINDFYATNNDAQFRNFMLDLVNENSCCLNASIDPTLMIKVYFYYNQQYAIIQQQHPEWSSAQVLAEIALNIAQLGLDVIGLIPGVGEIADAVNGTIYLYRGDNVNAALSFAATVPFAGWGATIGKFAVKAVPNVVTGGVKYLNITYKNGKYLFGVRYDLARVIVKNAGEEAHHIIPWAKSSDGVVQKAADAGFHMNDPINGVALEKFSKITGEGLHGNHPAYDDFVEKQLVEFGKDFPNATGEQAKNFLENNLIPRLSDYIDEAKDYTGGNLNDYFKNVINPANGVN